MQHYTYFDNNDGRKVIFECDAEGILEADDLLFKATGIVAAKECSIGCMVK